MRGFYTIQTQADFDAWLASQLWPQKKGGAPGAGAPLWRID